MALRSYTDRIRIDASTVVRHPNGWVDAWGTATRTGVLDYPEFGTKEYRPPEEVLAPESLASLIGVPVTIDHPDGDVTSSNARDLTHGWTMSVRPEPPTEAMADTLVHTRIRFATDEILEAIKGGTVELSCGYDADYEEIAGVDPNGVPYTGIQRGIRYNHLALVDLARAGHVARLRLDSAPRARKDDPMHELAIGKHKRRIATFLADSIKAAAESARAEIDAKRGRRDAIETSSLTIDGTELVLPKAMVDSLLASLGISSDAPPSNEDPNAVPPPTEDSRGAGRADARREPQGESVEVLTKRHVDAALAAERQRANVERKASPILGDGHDYADPWGTCAAAVTRIDAARETEAKRYADTARRTDKSGAPTAEALQAQGYLLAQLDGAAAKHRDSLDTSGELAIDIDTAQRRDAATDEGDGKGRRTDALADAHGKMRERILSGGKPKANTAA